MGNPVRALFREGAWAAAIEGLKVWAWPPVLAALTIVAGYAEKVPWVVILPAAGLVFASVATGLLRFDELLQRRTTAHKLLFAGANVAFDIAKDANGRPTGIVTAQPVILLQNNASFPLHGILDEMDASVDSLVNQNPPPDIKSLEITPHSLMVYRDHPIDMKSRDAKERIDGRIKLKLRYGRKGSERQSIEKHMNISCVLDKTIGEYLQQVATDVPQ